MSLQHAGYQEEMLKRIPAILTESEVAQSCPTLCNPMDYRPPLSMGFSRQERWSGLPFPSPGDLPNPGIEPGSPALQADTLSSEPPGKPYVDLKKWIWSQEAIHW